MRRLRNPPKLVPTLVLVLSCAVAGAEEKRIIKDKSPDGKFALLLTSGKEGWDTAIIDAKTKKKVFDLETVATSGDKERLRWAGSVETFQIEDYAKDATLVWSNDSQRVAYFNGDRSETFSTLLKNFHAS
jgi:hypothetical protein